MSTIQRTPGSAEVTMLNSMADQDFDTALALHKEWGIHQLDLRDGFDGKWVRDLTVEEAHEAKRAMDEAGLNVFCLSTSIFYGDIPDGEAAFREKHVGAVDHHLELALAFKPTVVRIIAAQLPGRAADASAVAILREDYPWLIEQYREVVDRFEAAGLTVTIENEANVSFLSRTQDFIDFFEWLDRPNVSLTWDINNQWATGVYPTLDDYEQLKDLIHYFHLKGGQHEGDDTRLKWNSSLEDSTYDVVGITQRVVDDGVSPVICLNPSQHGENKPDYDYENLAKRDLDYLRATIKGAR